MLGWFRSFSHDFSGALNQGNHNNFISNSLAAGGTMKGIVFDRNRAGTAQNEWNGQLVIATLETPGVEVSFQSTFAADGDGSEFWEPFARDGRLDNHDVQWVSSGGSLAGAIAIRFTLQPGEKRVVPMVVSWDLPVVEFGGGRKWYRR
jgi:non-lysosomal glucosylceramidase